MTDASHSNSTSHRPRFRLRSLLLAITFLSIFVAWIADRGRFNERIRQSKMQIQIQGEQLAALQQQQRARPFGIVQTFYWWAGSDEFIEMLRTTSDDDTFYDMAPSLSRADGPVLGESVNKLTELLDSSEERTRRRAVIALRFMQEASPERIAEDAPQIVSKLVRLLDDESSGVVAETIHSLKSFGPAARIAVDKLRKRMFDDDDYYAPNAALAIAEIDPAIDIGPRLIELVKTKHPNWYQAAFHLSRYADANQTRQILTKIYDDAQNASERNMAIQALNQNQIQPEAEP